MRKYVHVHDSVISVSKQRIQKPSTANYFVVFVILVVFVVSVVYVVSVILAVFKFRFKLLVANRNHVFRFRFNSWGTI